MKDIYYLAGLERQKDLMREAANEREAKLVQGEEKRSNKTLSWMGHRLTDIGNHLIDISGDKK
jgi:hypothetical protein